jgi:glycosyltransferase involved in cell wall biosynthesis
MNQSKKLMLFNLELDNKSLLLRSNIAWLFALEEYFDEILVVSTRVGETPFGLKKTTVLETGGGNTWKRIKAILKFTKLLPSIYRDRRSTFIFHHMSHRTAIYPGIVARAFGVKQALWFSHEHKPASLCFATFFVNRVFSPSIQSFPLNTRKLVAVGQAIDTSKFPWNRKLTSYRRVNDIVTIGRVSRSKHLMQAFEIFEDAQNPKENKVIYAIGPTQDLVYQREIEEKSGVLGIRIEFLGPIDSGDIASSLSDFCYYFSGTTKGVDRALIEAGVSGCLILSTNLGAMRLVGMSKYWLQKLDMELPSLDVQYQVLSSLSSEQRQELGKYVRKFTISNNDIKSTVNKIVREMNYLSSSKED